MFVVYRRTDLLAKEKRDRGKTKRIRWEARNKISTTQNINILDT